MTDKDKKKWSFTGFYNAGDEPSLKDTFSPIAAPLRGKYDIKNFNALSAHLTAKFHDEFHKKKLEKLLSPVPIKLETRLGGARVRVHVENTPENQIITIKKDNVTVAIAADEALSAEAANLMAAAAMYTPLNNREKGVVANGSDRNKIMLYLAAQKHGLKVQNAAEITALQANRDLWADVAKKWAVSQGEPEPVDIVAETRKIFNLPVGPLALRLNLVDEAERARAANQQAELLAIVEKRPASDTDDLLKQSPDAIKAKKLALGITDQDVQAARVKVDSKQGMPQGVPAFGMLLRVDQDKKNAALAVQAAVRSLDIVDKIEKEKKEKGSVPVHTAEEVDNFPNDGRFNKIGQPFKGKMDPDWLIAAQSNNREAVRLELLTGSSMMTLDAATHLSLGIKANALIALSAAAQEFHKLGREDIATALDLVRESCKTATAPNPTPRTPNP